MFVKLYLSFCVVMFLLVQESSLCPVIHINTERGADSNGYPQVTTILQSDNIREIFENVTQILLHRQEERFLECGPDLHTKEIVERITNGILDNVTQILLNKKGERFPEYKDFKIQEIVENATQVLLDNHEKKFRELLILLNTTQELIDQQKNSRDAQTVPQVSALPVDCQDIRMLGDTKSAVYTIYPSKDHGVSVYCDMDNGEWTVIQKRIDGTVNFKRDWVSYRDGFGTADHEYWLGNQYIHLLTSSEQYQLRIDMTDQMGRSKHVIYDSFSISDEESGFSLDIGGFNGYNDIKDEFRIHNGMKFSTVDRDQDKWSGSCSESYNGGWWYNSCHKVNLNGDYGSKRYAEGIIWATWTGNFASLSHVEMKIKRFMKDS